MFDRDRGQILEHCQQLAIRKLIMPGVYREDWLRLLQLSRRHEDMLYAALGLHPCFLDQADQEDLNELENLLQNNPQVVAIGEIGLDFFDKGVNEERQRFFFQQQVALADRFQLPLILHVRKAHDQAASILKRLKFSRGGVVHAYSGSLQQAGKYLELGFKLGIGGVVTYERSSRLHNIVTSLPLSAFLLETDAPDIPPHGHEKQRNNPEYLPEIFQAFAGKRPEPEDELISALYQNTVETFKRLMN